MFDPTAFDNMKTVLEGALYDLDSIGELVITDRNDLLNLAKLSRRFDMCFKLPKGQGKSVSAKIEMESKLVNLAAELLPSSHPENLEGCFLRLQFILKHAERIEYFQTIEAILLDIWGSTRKITQTTHYNPLTTNKIITNVITIEFERLISEEQIDDLIEMTDFMITTLKQLQTIKGG
jgi:hypothetical protein